MNVFIFRSKTSKALIAITPDNTGKNLPAEQGPWNPTLSGAITLGNGTSGIGGEERIITAIQRDGFFLHSLVTSEMVPSATRH